MIRQPFYNKENNLRKINLQTFIKIQILPKVNLIIQLIMVPFQILNKT